MKTGCPCPPQPIISAPISPPPAEGNTKREACLEQGRLARDRFGHGHEKSRLGYGGSGPVLEVFRAMVGLSGR